MNMSSETGTKSGRTRERVLHAAAQAFRGTGYALTSLRQIAENAGMQAGSLYYHFANKDELVEAVLDEGVLGAQRAAMAAIEALGGDANPLRKIEAAFRGHLAYTLEEADFAVATLRMLHQVPDAVRIRHLRKQRAYGRFYANLFEEAKQQGFIRDEFNLSALRMLLLGALNWSPEWYDPSGLSPDQLVEQLTSMMESGVVPRGSDSSKSTRKRR
jgi:AcrR family transcriptional regulator